MSNDLTKSGHVIQLSTIKYKGKIAGVGVSGKDYPVDERENFFPILSFLPFSKSDVW